jgi:hypothetical protein
LSALSAPAPTVDDGVAQAFHSLEQVRLPGGPIPTKWNIVYDQTAKVMRFRLPEAPDLPEVQVDFSALDFSGQHGVQVMDVDGQVTGERSGKFVPLRASMTANLLDHTFPAVERRLAPEVREAVSASRKLLACPVKLETLAPSISASAP